MSYKASWTSWINVWLSLVGFRHSHTLPFGFPLAQNYCTILMFHVPLKVSLFVATAVILDFLEMVLKVHASYVLTVLGMTCFLLSAAIIMCLWRNLCLKKHLGIHYVLVLLYSHSPSINNRIEVWIWIKLCIALPYYLLPINLLCLLCCDVINCVYI